MVTIFSQFKTPFLSKILVSRCEHLIFKELCKTEKVLFFAHKSTTIFFALMGLLQNLMFCGSLFSTQFFNYFLHIYYSGRFSFKTIWSNPIINFSLACNQRKKFANIVSQANQHSFVTDIFQPFSPYSFVVHILFDHSEYPLYLC